MTHARGRAARPGVWLAAALLVLVVGAIFAWRRHAAVETGTPAQQTLIVLPLHPNGVRREEAVLAEGLATEFGAEFARVDRLRTLAHATALRASNDHLDTVQLARLGATHALDGELQELGGDQLRVELRLRDVPAGRLLWTQTYERRLGDIAVLENDIVQAVATRLHLSVPSAAVPETIVDTQVFRDYLQARQIVDGPERARGIELLRAIVKRAPMFARAHALLARTLAGAQRSPELSTRAELDEAITESRTALDLQADLVDAHAAQAALACRVGDWSGCMDAFARALALDPGDTECRTSHAYWLSALGYIDLALAQAELARSTDPLNYNVNFARARLLDTAGRHDEAAQVLADLHTGSGGLVYARWHNAVWRHDYAAAATLVATMPRSDGFRESYTVVTEALSEPRLWPQALPLIGTSERASGGINVQRIMMPNPDYAVVIGGLEKMLRDGWPSYYMLLWMPEYAAMRRTAAFQDFLARTGLLDYWRARGLPRQCRWQNDAALCD